MSVFATFLCFSIFSRTLQDFGDGGAFPEIHLAQYPMNLGKPAESEAKTKSNALAVQLDATGKVKYDLIARQGHGKVDRSTRPLTWWPCLRLFFCHNLCDFVIVSWDSEVDGLISNTNEENYMYPAGKGHPLLRSLEVPEMLNCLAS